MRSLTILLVLLSAPSVLLAACTDSHDASDSGTRDSSLTDSGAGDSGSLDSGTDDGGPPPGDYYSCDYPVDCVVTANTCCGVCGRPTADDMTSINNDQYTAYYTEVACPEAATDPIGCPECAIMPNPNLVAGCSGMGGMCSLIDIENDSAISGCSVDEDCIVRVPTCCACGADTSPFNLVAMSRDGVGVLLPQICDPRADCAACEPVYPSDVSAVCTEGLCRLVLP